MNSIIKQVNFDHKGLVPAVLQDINSREVLMLGYMNRESLEKTIESGKVCFWSRSRQELWLKGETSGNYQIVKEIRVDCDHDALLILVEPAGPACHTGKQSCFDQALIVRGSDRLANSGPEKFFFLSKLEQLIGERRSNPLQGSYTSYLFQKGLDQICQKVGEETTELIIAAKNQNKEEIIAETADLFYHLLVLLKQNQLAWEEIVVELERRSQVRK